MNYELRAYLSQRQTLQIVSPSYRTKMMDWGLQVLSAFQRSTSKTFFMFASLMDKYCETRAQQMRVREVSLSEFHLLGLTAIFMSSKIEDPRPILLDEILTHAGFGAFTRPMVLNTEVEILKTLSFRLQIQDTSPVERSYSLLLTFTMEHSNKSAMTKPVDPHALLSTPELFPTL
jgi:hypothetical protein